eukprot:TRINITY_DN1861_c1_g1_i7.p5 TRINITY_DN1861_c1_g1~~TRINITY_DN1861_c1_g1_i7.p5  ORF type:complete len:165 (-),score=1.27 TRINITY_DN1861_c1_g1_i7:157-651(-)
MVPFFDQISSNNNYVIKVNQLSLLVNIFSTNCIFSLIKSIIQLNIRSVEIRPDDPKVLRAVEVESKFRADYFGSFYLLSISGKTALFLTCKELYRNFIEIYVYTHNYEADLGTNFYYVNYYNPFYLKLELKQFPAPKKGNFGKFQNKRGIRAGKRDLSCRQTLW